ncbi:bifunctional phosphopantothenoylcysteine decarboxylase/phosphopantothenate--cysteine ligase CoaBC [Rufibacter psychrotolerans]|uniref:bifunctional phosphopantothenoylcysteine decarboxylase/phosphopantothenate--cysteine ligase CoaBC n=1 Tax=Rufibacter psychrotolerans TaxID=2812556 RepID=UPI00293D9769|nr:bifunctional phosphopantothenoylcysteine decarboxylase/phosphopantothenate--cysteine ligase CoaBC [Rufibacter sp. SYSU D00308]
MFSGKKVLITAGPTYEPLDPVRFIGNHSTGKMGYALARTLAEQGAEVFLVSGPTALKMEHPNVQVTSVMTADEMYAACQQIAPEADLWIFAAAVADYKPSQTATSKIKKSDATFTIELVKNVDIAAALGQQKRADQFAVGFALETDQELENARAKLLKKNLNMVVLNSLRDPGAGFKHDTNKITIVKPTTVEEFALKTKDEVALDILESIKAEWACLQRK